MEDVEGVDVIQDDGANAINEGAQTWGQEKSVCGEVIKFGLKIGDDVMQVWRQRNRNADRDC